MLKPSTMKVLTQLLSQLLSISQDMLAAGLLHFHAQVAAHPVLFRQRHSYPGLVPGFILGSYFRTLRCEGRPLCDFRNGHCMTTHIYMLSNCWFSRGTM